MGLALPLTLTPALQPSAARAWLVSANEPREWIDLFVAGGILLSECDFVSFETGAQPKYATLVIPRGEAPSGFRVGVAYQRIRENVYLPADASVPIAISDDEFRLCFPPPTLFVWIPPNRFLSFEAKRIQSLRDLVTVAPPPSRDWSFAEPGVRLNGALLSLASSRSYTLEKLLGSGDGIGEMGGESAPLPEGSRLMDHAASRLFDAAARAGDLINEFRQRLSAMMAMGFGPSSPGGNAPAKSIPNQPVKPKRSQNPLGDALTRLRQALGAWNQRLTSQREREITKLLRLLQASPDLGLKFALPLTGNAFRGFSRPTSQLAPRNTSFSGLGFGAGAADFWDLSEKYQRMLRERYIELANRETQLGRHRRAAYIFGELLGDFPSAAGALGQGRFYREAAILWEKRMGNNQVAAGFYEKAGDFEDALRLYTAIHQHEKCAEIYDKLGRESDAREAYLAAVEWNVKSGNIRHAASIFETKLDAPQKAIDLLLGAWPDSPQAKQCVREAFAKLAQRGEIERALAEVKQLENRAQAHRHIGALAELLTEIATTHPGQDVQELAADRAKVQIARSLEYWPDGRESRELTRLLSKLAPRDRLLVRDIDRFRHPTRPTNVKRASRSFFEMMVSKTIHAPEVEWIAATTGDKAFYLAGRHDSHSYVARVSWNGEIQWRDLRRSHAEILEQTPVVILAPNESESSLVAHFIGPNDRSGRQFIGFPAEGALDKSMVTMSLNDLRTMGAIIGGMWFENDSFLAANLDQGSVLHLKHYISPTTPAMFWMSPGVEPGKGQWGAEDPEAIPTLPRAPMVADGKTILVGAGNRLLVFGAQSKSVRKFEIGAMIIQILVSPRLSPCSVVITDKGPLLFDHAKGQVIEWIHGAEEASCSWLAPTILGAWKGDAKIDLYDLAGGRVKGMGHRTLGLNYNPRQSRPLALVAKPNLTRGVVMWTSGAFEIFELDLG